jgi:hypothetical protein
LLPEPGKKLPGRVGSTNRAEGIAMKIIRGTKIRATENYESKKEKWLLQVAADSDLSRAGLRVAIGIAMHMNRKQYMLAWPGYGRLAKLLRMGRTTVFRGVTDLEARKHMRVVRSKNGAKHAPNHYHMNISRIDGVPPVGTGVPPVGTRVFPPGVPEPLSEPMREPTIRGREDILFFKESTHTEEKRLGEEERVENRHHLGQPKPLQPAQRIDYAAALDLLRPAKPQANRRCPAFLAVTDYLASLAPELPHPLLKRSRDGRFLIEGPIRQRSA